MQVERARESLLSRDVYKRQMMATGEVMSIGNSFEAAMMKAVSSIELGMDLSLIHI